MRRSKTRSRSLFIVLLSIAIAGVLTTVGAASAATSSSWSIVPSPNPPAPAYTNFSDVVCPSNVTCFAVGNYRRHKVGGQALLGTWNGSTWKVTPAPYPVGGSPDGDSDLNSVACVTVNRCFAVGSYQDPELGYSMFILQWNGNIWAVMTATDPPGLVSSSLSGVACQNSTTCFAVGSGDDGTSGIPLAMRWNGSSWSRVASPNPPGDKTGSFNDVACNGTTCFAVGALQDPETFGLQTFIEQWNGQAWSVVPSPNAADDNLLFGVTCAKPTRCVAVGLNALHTGTQKTLIERWNGTAWSIIASPNVTGAESNQLWSVACTAAASCTAVGYSVDSASATSSLVEQWNGTTWSIVTAARGKGSQLFGISCGESAPCTAVGNYFARRNGESWSVMPANTGSDSRLRRVTCVSTSDCFAVGDAGNGSSINTLIERWNGSGWSIVPSPNPAGHTRRLSDVSCAATVCMAVGEVVTGTAIRPFVERWNGNAWSIILSPNPGANSSLRAVKCLTLTVCFAVGHVGNKTLIEQWNGTKWSIVTSPNRVGDTNVLSGISCTSATACFAVGTVATTTDDGETSKTLIERWNGTIWSLVASPSPGPEKNRLNDVSCASATSCFAVGAIETLTFDFNRTTLIERWNGTTWSVSPSAHASGFDELYGIACASATSCTAVGRSGGPDLFYSFSTIAERWNGATWSVMNTPNRPEAWANQLYGVACRPSLCFAVGSSTTDLNDSSLVVRNP